jgi:hypothetical protein
MSVFNADSFGENSTMGNDLKHPELLDEMFLVEEASHFNEAQIKQFLESDVCQTLLEAGKFRKKTLVR